MKSRSKVDPKDIVCLEKVQRRATKYILSDFSTDYKSRLRSLHLLPLMYWLELQDLIFLVKSIKDPPDNCDISSYVTFSHSTTRASYLNHLQHNFCHSSTVHHFYFNRVVSLWNSLVSHIDLSLSTSSIKRHIISVLWDHFLSNFDPHNPCSFHYICPCSSCSFIPHL